MFSFGTANHENEPSRPISSAVFVRGVVLGTDASNRLQHCGPGVFGRRDVSSEHCAGAHTDEGRVRNIRVVLFGVHISGRLAQCGASRGVYNLRFGAVSPEFSCLCLAAMAQQSSASTGNRRRADAFVERAGLDCASVGFAHRSGAGARLWSSADSLVCAANVLYAAQTGPGGQIFSSLLRALRGIVMAVTA